MDKIFEKFFIFGGLHKFHRQFLGTMPQRCGSAPRRGNMRSVVRAAAVRTFFRPFL